MHLTAQILAEDEQERIHEMSIHILEEVGIRFHGHMAPKVLKENGVYFNPEDKIAKIPRQVVSQAIDSAPKSFVLGARNAQYNLPLPTPLRVMDWMVRLPSPKISSPVKDAMGRARTSRMPCAFSKKWIWE